MLYVMLPAQFVRGTDATDGAGSEVQPARGASTVPATIAEDLFKNVRLSMVTQGWIGGNLAKEVGSIAIIPIKRC